MRRITVRWIALGLSVTCAAWSCTAGAGEPGDPIPQREDLVTGTLDNGLRYMILRHANPPGRLSMQLHVATGSMNETDAQRGLAHFIEHLAFNGSVNFPPGEAVKYFESLGLTFGEHQNARTGFDGTSYTLLMPDAERDTIDDGMLFLSDVAGRLLFDPEEIEKERGVLLGERTAYKGPWLRLYEMLLPAIFPGSRIADRLPLGQEEIIENAPRAEIVSYYKKWYVPGNMTLLVVADCSTDLVIEVIEENFSDLPADDVPEPRNVNVARYIEQRGLAAADPDLTDCHVEMMMVDKARPPVLTIGQARDEMIDMLGTVALNRRLAARVNAGEAPYRAGLATMRNLFQAAHIVSVEAVGEPGEWLAMLADLVVQMQRARLHGFTQREVEDARQEMLAQTEQFAAQESTIPARSVLDRMSTAVAEKTPLTSASQMLEIMRTLLPGIGPDEVSEAFSSNFDPSAMTFLVTTRSSVDTPSPTGDDVLAVARVAMSLQIEPLDEPDRPTTLLAETPTPTKMVNVSVDPTTHVLSTWLDNGVRVHYRFMDQEQDNVTVTITLAGGRIEETADDRGLTWAALQAWIRPATHSLTSTNIRDLMTGLKVCVSGSAQDDALVLTITGHPADLEAGFQLAHILLTQPRVEQASLDQWKSRQLQNITQRRVDPMSMLHEAVRNILYSEHEPQRLPLTAENIERINLNNAQAWLDRLIADAPIEVAIVGDVERSVSLKLAQLYVGSLPPRARMSSETLDEMRMLRLNDPPFTRTVTVETATPKAVVLTGFFAVDADNVRDRRLMDLAARILNSRMFERIRENEQLVYSIGVYNSPADVYPGQGLVYALCPCEPAAAETLSGTIKDMFDEFASVGPTVAEVNIAREQLLNRLAERRATPKYWVGRLSDMTLRGRSLREVSGEVDAYAEFTAEDVRDVVRRYYDKKRLIDIIVRPTGARTTIDETEGD
ncbi:MAG: insulinase family protein [Phycisphaerales bacterium]|nr:insulinase family protein [Phycisphaerales bacterium]